MRKLFLLWSFAILSLTLRAQTEIFVAPPFVSGLEVYSDWFIADFGPGMKHSLGFNLTFGTIGFQKDKSKRNSLSASYSSFYSNHSMGNYLIERGYVIENIESTHSREEGIEGAYRLEFEHKKIMPWNNKALGFDVSSLLGYGVNIYRYAFDRHFANYFVQADGKVERFTMYNHLPLGFELGLLADFELRETVKWLGFAANFELATYLQLPEISRVEHRIISSIAPPADEFFLINSPRFRFNASITFPIFIRVKK